MQTLTRTGCPIEHSNPTRMWKPTHIYSCLKHWVFTLWGLESRATSRRHKASQWPYLARGFNQGYLASSRIGQPKRRVNDIGHVGCIVAMQIRLIKRLLFVPWNNTYIFISDSAVIITAMRPRERSELLSHCCHLLFASALLQPQRKEGT